MVTFRMSAKRLKLAAADTSGVSQRHLNWNNCCICQVDSKEELIEPYRNKDQSKVTASYKSLSDILIGFKEINSLPASFDISLFDEGQGIEHTLISRQGKWHKTCRLKYNNTKLERALTAKIADQSACSVRTQDDSSRSSTQTRSLSTTPKDLKEDVCFICNDTNDASPLYHIVSIDVTDTLKKWALELGRFDLAGVISRGDLIAQEAKYHKICHTRLYNQYKAKVKLTSMEGQCHGIESLSLCSTMAFEHIAQFIRDKLNSDDTEYIFKMANLTTSYKGRFIELLGQHAGEMPNIHTTRLRERILLHFPELRAQKSGREYLLVRDAANVFRDVSSEEVSDADAAAFFKFIRSLRREISEVSCSFTGLFENGCQEASVPPGLLAMTNLLLYGCTLGSETPSTQSAVTISQLIVLNHRARAPKSESRFVRHKREHEPPLPMYMALSAYSKSRSRKRIDEMHELGISVSSDRVDKVTSALCQLQVLRANEEGVLCPSNLRKGLFTMGAYDNIDHNPSSVTSQESFHGTSLSIFQVLTPTQLGERREFASNFCDVDLTSKTVPELPEAYGIVKAKFLPTEKPVQPKCTQELIDTLIPSLSVSLEYVKEMDWLDHVFVHLTKEKDINDKNLDMSWAAFHASRVTTSVVPGIQALLPLFYESSSSVSMIRHGMDVIRSITSFLNPGQTPMITVDQPLFTLCKMIQWNWPDVYGEDKFVVLFAPFHLEQGFLRVLGKLLDSSGWSALVAKSGISTERTADSILKVTHVTKARKFHQVTAATLYILLKEAYDSEAPEETMELWVKRHSEQSPTFQFWLLVLNLEILLLSFVRSIREGKYDLFKRCIKAMLPWFFLLDHVHYARWLTIHVKDLEELPLRSPAVYAEFKAGNFVIRKSSNPFSAIAVDQAHEQHNKNVKDDGGAVGILQDPAALRKWAMAGPEIQRLVNEFTSQTKSRSKHKPLHHEQYLSFQEKFVDEIDKLRTSFMSAGNPFEETSGDLISLENRMVSDAEAVKMLRDSERKGIELYQSFVSERLVQGSTVSIFAPMKAHKLRIFKPKRGNGSGKRTVQNVQSDVHLFQRCLTVSMNRKLDLQSFFKYENSPYPPSLSSAGHLRHAIGKADLLDPLEEMVNEDDHRFPGTCDAIVYDGAALIHSIQPRVSRTFGEYCVREFHQAIVGCIQSVSAKRLDMVWDMYSAESLKNSLRDARGEGIRRQVLPNSPVPRNWREFLRNNNNKEDIFSLLGRHLVENVRTAKVVTNNADKYVSSETALTSLVGLTCTSFEEADGRIIVHTRDAVIHGAKTVLIRTVDTDVLVLAISFFFELRTLGLEELWVSINLGKKQRYIPAHTIALALGSEKSVALRGFHAFTGCDTVSTFAFHGKLSAWNTWKCYDNATSAFTAISTPLPGLQMNVLHELEQFVVCMYNKKYLGMTLDKTRHILSTSEEKLFDRLPPTSEALRQHALRAVYQGGHIWGQCMNPRAKIPSPDNWGWMKDGSNWLVKWTSLPTIWQGCRDLVKCRCKAGCSSTSNCSCRRSLVECVPFLCVNCKNCTNMTSQEHMEEDAADDMVIDDVEEPSF